MAQAGEKDTLEGMTESPQPNGRTELYLKILQVALPLLVAGVIVWLHSQNGLIHQTPAEKLAQVRTELQLALEPMQKEIQELKALTRPLILPRAEERFDAVDSRFDDLESKVDKIHSDVRELMSRRE